MEEIPMINLQDLIDYHASRFVHPDHLTARRRRDLHALKNLAQQIRLVNLLRAQGKIYKGGKWVQN